MSNLSAYSLIQQIHNQAIALAKEYKKLEVELLEILEKVDTHKVYRKFGYPSLFQYVSKELGLTESTTYTLINVYRKTKVSPFLKLSILRNELSISKAHRIVPVITKDSEMHWIQLAKDLSKRELEREVAAAKPSVAIPEKANYVPARADLLNEKPAESGYGDKAEIRVFEAKYPDPGLASEPGQSKPLKSVRIHLQLGLSEKLMLDFRRAQSLVSSKLRGAASLENTIEALVTDYIRRNCPLEKAKRAEIRGALALPVGLAAKAEGYGEVAVEKSKKQKLSHQRKRRPIKAQLRHKVYQRDSGQCTYMRQNGERCRMKNFLEIHHILPVSKGGKNSLENLTLMCSGHHKLIHDETDHRNQNLQNKK